MTPLPYFLQLILFIGCLSISIEAHGYLKSPRSRNYYAHVEGASWGTSPGIPPAEYCPHCLNFKDSNQICATGQSQNYDTWTDVNGDPMPWISQAIYTEGQEIIIEAVLTANHAGHIDMFACPDGNASTQQCFLDNPLTFVKDLLHDGPVDSEYPSRAYVAPATDFKFLYRLPMGLHGSKVMLQWRYVTANSCFPPGYDRAELGLRDRGWLRSAGMSTCSWPLNWTGERDSTNPEQFWNCAEVTINASSPTKSPRPTRQPVTNPPVPVSSPVQLPSPITGGCCTWNGGDSCGPTWCNDSKSNCEGSCAGTYIGGGPIAPTAPVAPTPTAPTPTAPTPNSGLLTATTTRYWDCSGGACGCAYLPFGPGTDSQPAHCYSNAMFEAPPGNRFGARYYGTAAISQALGGGNWMASGCGKCWKVRGWSNIPNKDIFQTTLVLKGTNYCPPENDACSGNKAHFDIAAPGFDVTQFSLSNTCSERESNEIEGFQSCGRWMIDSSNSDENCDCSKFNDSVLKAGCENFFSLLWDNSVVEYEEVACPEELSRLNCWNENGGKYPEGVPEFCASNLSDTGPTTPTSPTTPTPTAPSPTTPSHCNDSPFRFQTIKDGKKIRRDCTWVAARGTSSRCNLPGVREHCSSTCNTCSTCVDSNSRFKFTYNGKKITRNCLWTSNKKTQERCSISGMQDTCRSTCGMCSETPVASPVEAPISGDYCCSDDLKTCKTDTWCGASESNCKQCNSRWILKNPNCELKWWDDCKVNPDGCCPPAICQDFGTWAQCRA